MFERFSGLSVRYPWLVLSIIAVISVASIITMVARPMPQEFAMEDWLPDVEEAKTWSLYEERFSSSYFFPILVRGDGGDIVTRQGFIDILELSANISSDPTFIEWQDQGASGANPSEPATAMYTLERAVASAENALSCAENLTPLFDTLDILGPSVRSVNGNGSMYQDRVSLMNALSPVAAALEESGPALEGVDLVDGIRHDGAMEYILTFGSDQDLKDRISYLLAYDIYDPAIMNSTFHSLGFISSAQVTLSDLAEAKNALGSIRDDPLAFDGTVNATIDGETRTIPADEYISMIMADIDDVSGSLMALLPDIQRNANPLELVKATADFSVGSFMLEFSFTKDFEPAEGEIRAEGCLVNVMLNHTLNSMDDETVEIVRTIETNLTELSDQQDRSHISSIHGLGSILINDRINEASMDSMSILLPAAFGLIILILTIIYRNVTDVILSLTGLALAILWMFGFGSLLQFSNNPMITAVPVLIVGLGIDYGIHMTMRYREEVYKGVKVKEALKRVGTSVGVALLLATLTTVVAFFSNIASPIGLIMQFGVMAGIGILSSFFIMLFMIPAVKSLVDIKKARRGRPLFGGHREGEIKSIGKSRSFIYAINNGMASLTVGAEKHPVIVLSVIALITLGMGAAAVQNELVFSVNAFLPEGLEEADDIQYLLSEFKLVGGAGDTAIILVEGDIAEPDVLRAMDSTLLEIGGIGSRYIATKNDGGETVPNAEYLLPALRDLSNNLGLVDPEDLLHLSYNSMFDTKTGLPLENATSDGIEVVFDIFQERYPALSRRVLYSDEDGDFRMAVITVTVSTKDDNEAKALWRELKDSIGPLEGMEGNGVDTVRISGSSILMAVITTSINESQISSLGLTLLISLLVLTIVFFIERRSLFLGAVATLPMILCVVWILGTMYIIGLPLNAMTITIGSLTVGLGITYGIHITHRFLEDLGTQCDVHEACRNTLMNTGSALLGAAVTTVSGFALLILALMPPLQQFGAVTALTIIYSFLSSVLLLPVLLVLWAKSMGRYRHWKECRS